MLHAFLSDDGVVTHVRYFAQSRRAALTERGLGLLRNMYDEMKPVHRSLSSLAWPFLAMVVVLMGRANFRGRIASYCMNPPDLFRKMIHLSCCNMPISKISLMTVTSLGRCWSSNGFSHPPRETGGRKPDIQDQRTSFVPYLSGRIYGIPLATTLVSLLYRDMMRHFGCARHI